MHLQESGEMYLETVYILSKNGVVRSLDVAEYMERQPRRRASQTGRLSSHGQGRVSDPHRIGARCDEENIRTPHPALEVSRPSRR